MAYNPQGLSLVISAGADSPRTALSNNVNRWYYNSADALATAQGADYFSDAKERGLVLFDIVEVAVSGVLKSTTQYVSAIDATTGAATISAAA